MTSLAAIVICVTSAARLVAYATILRHDCLQERRIPYVNGQDPKLHVVVPRTYVLDLDASRKIG